MPQDRPRARDLGIAPGSMPPGPLNAITDVAGVQVGHVTIARDQPDGGPPLRTGVTAVLPHGGNLFTSKVPAAFHVINGFGKATGSTQIQELGVLETPVALTGTLSVGAVMEGLVRDALAANPEIGRSAGTVNAVVAECSDARLSDIRALAVRPRHVLEAIAAAAGGPVAEDSVGAGTGMICYGWKGGIGTASRLVGEAAGGFTVGALVLANFGRRQDLRITGVPVGEWLSRRDETGGGSADGRGSGDGSGRGGGSSDGGSSDGGSSDGGSSDGGSSDGGSSAAGSSAAGGRDGGGSCVAVLATDAPADHRQLGRLARRVQYGLGRTGTYGDHGSGEYAIAFSTAHRVAHTPQAATVPAAMLAEDGPMINELFRAVTESVEEAVLNALLRARSAGPAADAIAPPIDPAAVAAILAEAGRAKAGPAAGGPAR